MTVKYKDWKYFTNKITFQLVADVVFAIFFTEDGKEHNLDATSIEIIS